MSSKIAVSNWELAEIYCEARRGVSVCALADQYDVDPYTIANRIRRFEQTARDHGYKVVPIKLSYEGIKDYYIERKKKRLSHV